MRKYVSIVVVMAAIVVIAADTAALSNLIDAAQFVPGARFTLADLITLIALFIVGNRAFYYTLGNK